jgi:hypothetical protein
VLETEVYALSRAQFDTLAAEFGALAVRLMDALASNATSQLANATSQWQDSRL